jgi:branched-chain amino acid transport system substrate-binding protein
VKPVTGAVHSGGVPRRRLLQAGLAALLPAPWGAALAAEPERVRIAFIDPLSGPAADIGRNSLRSWQFMAEQLQAQIGLRFVVAGFDNKGSPQESVMALKVAIDQGFRFVVQGNGSGVTAALNEAIARHNLLRPERAVLLINYAAMDPALTGEHCSRWHFRVDADTSMKMRAMTRFMARQADLQRVYLINQNYAHGQQFANYFRTEAALQAPRLQIVGEELHSAFSVQDFTPHVQRIRQSQAQAVVTGNWGADLRGLVRAMQAQNLFLPLWAYYPQLPGTPQVLAATGDRLPVYQVATGHTNQPGPLAPLAQAFRQRHGEDLVVQASYDGIRMLAQAITQAGSTDPLRVAERLAGLSFETFNGPGLMRAEDHQLQTRVCISRWERVSARNPIGADGTDFTFAPLQCYEPAELALPLRCVMRSA